MKLPYPCVFMLFILALGTGSIAFLLVFLKYTVQTLIALPILFSLILCLNWVIQNRLLRCPSYQVPFLGLPATGKTSLVCRLCKEANKISTTRRYKETLEPEFFKFSVSHSTSGQAMQIKSTDFGGRHWRSLAFEYMVHGAIFVVDASRPATLDAARDMLEQILTRAQMGRRPILILANKADRPNSSSAEEIKYALNLSHLRHGGVPWAKARLVVIGGRSYDTNCPFSWLGGDVLRLILEFTGTGENQEKVISDPFMCSAIREGVLYSKQNYELADGLSWLMDKLLESEAEGYSLNQPWLYDKFLRHARKMFWQPERPSFQYNKISTTGD